MTDSEPGAGRPDDNPGAAPFEAHPEPPYGQPPQPPYGHAAQLPYGQPAQPPYGQPPQPPYGQSPQPPYGQPPYGQPPQPPYGQPPYGQPPHPQGWPGAYGPPTGPPSGPYPYPYPQIGGSAGPNRSGSKLAVVSVIAAVVIVALAVALTVSLTRRNHAGHQASAPTSSAPSSSAGALVPQQPSSNLYQPYTANSGTEVYSSDFSESDGWDTGAVEPSVQANVGPAGYRITASGSVHHLLSTPYGDPSPTLSVTATATSFPATNVSFGTGCQSGVTGSYYIYQFIAYPDGEWYLESVNPSDNVESIQNGTTSPLPATASVELSCISGPDLGGSAQTLLIGYIDGQTEIRFAAQQKGLDSSGWVPVLLMDSYGPQVSVTFKSMSVRDSLAPTGSGS